MLISFLLLSFCSNVSLKGRPRTALHEGHSPRCQHIGCSQQGNHPQPLWLPVLHPTYFTGHHPQDAPQGYIGHKHNIFSPNLRAFCCWNLVVKSLSTLWLGPPVKIVGLSPLVFSVATKESGDSSSDEGVKHLWIQIFHIKSERIGLPLRTILNS